MGPNAGEDYTCARCGGTFEATVDDAEAVAEKDRIFGDIPLEECDVVCDDCFQLVMGNLN